MKKIKFSICLFIIIIGILLFTKLPVFATTGKATTSSLRIRKSASTESEVLEVLAVGDKVEILSEEGDWYKISAKGYTGYVSKSYINVDGNTANNNIPNSENSNENNTINNEQNNSEQTQENSSENNNTQQGDNQSTQNVVPENNATNKVYKIAENTQVYILPVLISETIGDINKDANVSLINNAGLWGYIKTDSVKGWVRIDKLSSEDVPAQTQNDSSNEQNNENNNAQNSGEQNNDSNSNAQSNNTENNNSTANNAQENQQNNNSESNKQNNSTTVAYQPKTMYTKSTAVNVRSQSNTNSDIITGVVLNTQVKVVGEENGWYKVEVNGKSGYIRKDLLSDTKTETSSRSGNIERTKQDEQTQAQNNQTTTKVTTTTTPNESTTTTVTTATTPNASNSNTVQTATTSLPPSTTTSSGVTGNDIVAYAKQFLGYRYVYGAAGPNSFDCSGFTMYVYKHFGYSLSHSSKVQATQGVAVTGDLQAGDILVFKNGSSIGHVGIYIGNDKFIHASDSTTGVIISNLSDKWNISKYVGARRILK